MATEALPADGRASLEDYVRSGFDRGHLAPAGDMPTVSAQAESFSLANIVPQNRVLNRGLWSDIEESTRKVGRRVERRPVLPLLRAHADLIDPIGFEDFLRGPAAGHEFDLMLEAKAKDLALLRLREQLEERGFGWEDGRIVAGSEGD